MTTEQPMTPMTTRSALFSAHEIARFILIRKEDVSGVSGMGVVAEGVRFSDGVCALRWITAHRSTAIYATFGELMAIHGHDGNTEAYFADAWVETRAGG